MNHTEPPATGLRILFDLARAEGGRPEGGLLHLPPSVGTGFIRAMEPEPGLKLAIHKCCLAREFVLQRAVDESQSQTLLIGFSCFDPARNGGAFHLSSVHITSADIGLTTVLPAHTEFFLVAISVPKNLLLSWLGAPDQSAPAILATRHPLVLDTLMTPEIQATLFQFAESRPSDPLDAFFLKIKTQELLYLLFRELAKRESAPMRHLHTDDVERIFGVRAALVAALDTPPLTPELARKVGLSETKMKAVFRQVFGTSLYDYFQNARMEEAKRLLEQLSVSQVGNRLGFTNLSHFARLFEKHHGLTPKKYQATHLK